MDVLEKLKYLVSSGKDPKQILEQIEAAQKEEIQETLTWQKDLIIFLKIIILEVDLLF